MAIVFSFIQGINLGINYFEAYEDDGACHGWDLHLFFITITWFQSITE